MHGIALFLGSLVVGIAALFMAVVAGAYLEENQRDNAAICGGLAFAFTVIGSLLAVFG